MDFFGTEPRRRPDEQPKERWSTPGGLKVTLFLGELAEAPAEVLCTSTNPKLSLLGGTGAAVIDWAGWGVREEAAAIVERERVAIGRDGLEVGSVHRTTAGRLPHAFLLHCVASGPGHAGSADAIRSCVRGALAEADQAECASVALPVFGAGHASYPFDRAVRAMAEALHGASTAVQRVVLVVWDADRVKDAVRILDEVLPRNGAARPSRSR